MVWCEHEVPDHVRDHVRACGSHLDTSGRRRQDVCVLRFGAQIGLQDRRFLIGELSLAHEGTRRAANSFSPFRSYALRFGFVILSTGFAAAPNFRPGTASAVMAP